MVYCTVSLKRCLSFRLGEKVFAIATVALFFFFFFCVKGTTESRNRKKVAVKKSDSSFCRKKKETSFFEVQNVMVHFCNPKIPTATFLNLSIAIVTSLKCCHKYVMVQPLAPHVTLVPAQSLSKHHKCAVKAPAETLDVFPVMRQWLFIAD